MIKTYTIKYAKVRRRTGLHILIIVVSAIAFVVFVFFGETAVYSNVAMLVMASAGLLYSFLSKRREDPVQYFHRPLIISLDAITVGETSYPIEHVVNLKLEINEFDGEERNINGSDKYILNGTKNRISFSYLGQEMKTNFYLVSEVQKNQFRDIFHHWYLNRIPFTECDKGGKTYLLEKLNYSEIQEFKKKYGLSNFC